MRTTTVVVRIAGAALIAAAIIAQLARSIEVGAAREPVGTTLANFFSFFTIQANLLSIVSLVLAAIWLLRGGDSARIAVLRLCVATYMATTGVVYNLLLRGIELPQGQTVPWSNEVLHVVAPLLLVLDWLLAPGRRRVGWKAIGAVVAFPIVWAVYTLIRGPIAGWYPYPFLDPSLAPTGYASVAFYVVLIAVIIGGVGALLVLENRKRAPVAQ